MVTSLLDYFLSLAKPWTFFGMNIGSVLNAKIEQMQFPIVALVYLNYLFFCMQILFLLLSNF